MWSGYQADSSEHHGKDLEELGRDPAKSPRLMPRHFDTPVVGTERGKNKGRREKAGAREHLDATEGQTI